MNRMCKDIFYVQCLKKVSCISRVNHIDTSDWLLVVENGLDNTTLVFVEGIIKPQPPVGYFFDCVYSTVVCY